MPEGECAEVGPSTSVYEGIIMSKKLRATAAAVAMAPVIALGSGMAAAEPAPVPPPPVPVPVSTDAVQPAALFFLFPWNFLVCLPTLILYPVCLV